MPEQGPPPLKGRRVTVVYEPRAEGSPVIDLASPRRLRHGREWRATDTELGWTGATGQDDGMRMTGDQDGRPSSLGGGTPRDPGLPVCVDPEVPQGGAPK